MSFDYKIIRSEKRKTIALQIKNNEVIVRVPTCTSLTFIQTIIKEKTPWILEKLATLKQKPSPIVPNYLPNSTILINGNEKKLCVSYQKQTAIAITEQEFKLILPLFIQKKSTELNYLTEQIKKYLARWMKEQAEAYLENRLGELSAQLSLVPTSYKVRRYKARWGSCNNKHELSFNYLLAMTPDWVFDYVIIHELCHIKHLNHSAKFWALVKNHMPNYQDASHWLKKNQHKMHW